MGFGEQWNGKCAFLESTKRSVGGASYEQILKAIDLVLGPDRLN
jgi:hypothetical protein